jgi:hypothetical protein
MIRFSMSRFVKTPPASGVFYYLVMREIWETPFGNAVLKIERAKKHISDIEQRGMF